MPGMTSRERMRAFYAGLPVDRIPNGLGGCETAGLHILAYENFKRVLGVNDPTNRMYTFMTNSVFEPSVIDAMEGDCIVLNSQMCPSPLWGPAAEARWKDQVFWGKTFQVPVDWQFCTHADGRIVWDDQWHCPPGGIFFDPLPGDQANQVEASPSPDDYHPPHEIPEQRLRAMESAAKWLFENTEYSITAGESIVALQLRPGGTQNWWMRMLTDPEACHEFLAKAVDAATAQLEQVHQAVGSYCDAMIVADDMGENRGVTVGPDLWREIYKPHYAELWGRWKEISSMTPMLHCCGSVVDILDDLIECGVEVFNPIQRSARGMEASNLAERFGGRLIFYGGALDAVLTPPDTPDDVVYDEAVRTITTFARAGRYIFAGTHNLPGDTPPGHLQAILEAYRHCRDGARELPTTP